MFDKNNSDLLIKYSLEELKKYYPGDYKVEVTEKEIKFSLGDRSESVKFEVIERAMNSENSMTFVDYMKVRIREIANSLNIDNHIKSILGGMISGAKILKSYFEREDLKDVVNSEGVSKMIDLFTKTYGDIIGLKYQVQLPQTSSDQTKKL